MKNKFFLVFSIFLFLIIIFVKTSFALNQIIIPNAILECIEANVTGTCSLAAINASDGTTEQFRLSDNAANKYGRLNTSHYTSLPSNITIQDVKICIYGYRDSIVGDDPNDACALYAGENSTGIPSYIAALPLSRATCLNWTTTSPGNTVCVNITNFINSRPDPKKAAEKIIISLYGYESADRFADFLIDFVYVNITYNLPPSITLNQPPNNTQFNNTQDIIFNFTAIDDTNTTLACSIYLDGILNQTNNSVINNTLTNFLINGISYGSHNWKVNCSDGSLTNVSETRYFSIIDTLAPSIYYNPNTDNTGAYSKNWIFINVTCSDVNKDSVILNWNGINESFDNSAGNIYWENKTGLSDGNYSFYAWCNDSFGNSNQTETRVIILDTTAPQINIVYPENKIYNVNVSELNYTYSDANPDSCWYSTDGGITNSTPINAGENFTNVLSIEGNNTWILYCNDSAGNLNATTVNFVKDTIAPIILIISPQNTTYNNATILVNISAYDANIDAIWFTNSTGQNETYTNPVYRAFNEGSNILYAWANDSAGNINSTSVSFTIDTQGPIFSDEAINDSLLSKNEFVKLNQTVTDISGVSSVKFNISYNALNALRNGDEWYLEWQCDNSGIYYWYGSWANDSLGNINTIIFSVPLNWTCDADAPIVMFVSPTPSNNAILNVNYVYVNITANENLNVAILEWNNTNQSMNGNENNWYINKTVADGFYVYKVYVSDIAGNWNVSETRYVTIDTTPPSIQLNSPGDGLVTSNTTIAFNCSAYDLNNLSNITLWLNLSGWNANETVNVNENSASVLFIKNFDEGIYLWSCSACDAVGNCNLSNENRTFIIDLDVPIINYVDPTDPDNAYVNRLWTFVNVSINDNNDIDSCWIEWDGNNESMAKSGIGNDVYCYINKSSLEGNHSYNVYANDSANNIGVAGLRNIVFDITMPSIYNLSISTSRNTAIISFETDEEANATINYGTSQDNLSLIAENDIYVISHSITLTSLNPSTTYYFNITICDRAGNCNVSGIYNFTTRARGGGGGGRGAGGTTGVSGGGGGAGEGGKEKEKEAEKPVIEIFNKYDITKKLEENKQALVKIKRNERIYFEFKKELHYVIINHVSDDYVDIEIHSKVKYDRISKLETNFYDIDEDGKEDISITYNGLIEDKAVLVFKTLCECPGCSEWKCEKGIATRKCYRCGKETNYECLEYVEKKEKECETKISKTKSFYLILFLIILIFVFILKFILNSRRKNVEIEEKYIPLSSLIEKKS